jgi:hypothetical protein
MDRVLGKMLYRIGEVDCRGGRIRRIRKDRRLGRERWLGIDMRHTEDG